METDNNVPQSVVILGATGAVGTETVKQREGCSRLGRLTLLGRRRLEGCMASCVQQENIDIFKIEYYERYLQGH